MAVDIDPLELVRALDRVGIAASALSGVEVGVRKRLDVFGLLVMGVVTATGGGLLRDVVAGRVPFVISHPDYLLWAMGSTGIAILVLALGQRVPAPLLALAAALGLGAFAAAGALVAIDAGLSFPAAVILAIVTATGGGVLRDLLAAQVPLVLRAEVNATAAGIGGAVVWLLEPWSIGAAALAGLLAAALVRVVTLALDVHLPIPGARQR